MATPIYQILLYSNPQVLQDLDRYQMKYFGTHIENIPEEKSLITIQGEIESLEEIQREMAKAPSRSRS